MKRNAGLGAGKRSASTHVVADRATITGATITSHHDSDFYFFAFAVLACSPQ